MRAGWLQIVVVSDDLFARISDRICRIAASSVVSCDDDGHRLTVFDGRLFNRAYEISLSQIGFEQACVMGQIDWRRHESILLGVHSVRANEMPIIIGRAPKTVSL